MTLGNWNDKGYHPDQNGANKYLIDTDLVCLISWTGIHDQTTVRLNIFFPLRKHFYISCH